LGPPDAPMSPSTRSTCQPSFSRRLAALAPTLSSSAFTVHTLTNLLGRWWPYHYRYAASGDTA